jgi:outer membrane protein assembly factor BamB
VQSILTGLALLGLQTSAPDVTRQWTTYTGPNPKILGVRGDSVFFNSKTRIGAIDRNTGKVLWSAPKPASTLGYAALSDLRIVALLTDGKTSELASFDLSGAKLTSIAVSTQPATIYARGHRVYDLDTSGRLTAYDETLTHKAWDKVLVNPSGYASGTLASDGETIVASVSNSGTFALDTQTGSILWTKPNPYPPQTFVMDGGLVYLRQTPAEICDVRTGRTLWRPQTNLYWIAILNGVAISEDFDYLTGFDWKTGAQLWSRPAVLIMGSEMPATLPGPDGKSLLVRSGKRVLSLTAQGTQLWSKVFVMPEYAAPDRWIVEDSDRLLGYGPAGARMPTKARSSESDKEAEAEKLVREYEFLDENERDRLVSLSPYGVSSLLSRFCSWAEELEGPANKGQSNDRAEMLSELLYRIGLRLPKLTAPAKTDDLLRVIEKLGSRSRWLDPLERAVLAWGDPSRPIPFFLNTIRSGSSPSDWFAPEIVARSSDPQSVKFMIATMLNPKANSRLRNLACLHLASTGDEIGRKAIVAARRGEQTIRHGKTSDAAKIMEACVHTYFFGRTSSGLVVRVIRPDVAPFEIHIAGTKGRWLPADSPPCSPDFTSLPKISFSSVPFKDDDASGFVIAPDGRSAKTYMNFGITRGSISVPVSLQKFGKEWFVMSFGDQLEIPRLPP